MRIIKGRFGRRLLYPPSGLPVRPSTDLGKESLFNILENKIEFELTHALDLFAGTGSISFELVSRGCVSVTAVDKDFRCIRYIKKVADELGMPELRSIRTDVFRFLQRHRMKYDFIFADPPYDFTQEDYEKLIQLIQEAELLQPEGVFVIEHSKWVDFQDIDLFTEQRKYGKVHFSFFEKE